MTKVQKDKVQAIKTWLKNCNPSNPSHQQSLHRAILMIYSCQTADEQATQHTHQLNNRGFNGRDAAFGSAMAEKIMDIQQGRSQYATLTPKMYTAIKRMMVKYARQLSEISGK